MYLKLKWGTVGGPGHHPEGICVFRTLELVLLPLHGVLIFSQTFTCKYQKAKLEDIQDW